MNVGSETTTLPQTFDEADALYKKAGKVLGTPKVSLNKGEKITTIAPKVTKKAKKVGVVGISKAENVQLGLILRWIALELDWDTIPNEVLVNPEALTKLFGRYKVKGTIYE